MSVPVILLIVIGILGLTACIIYNIREDAMTKRDAIQAELVREEYSSKNKKLELEASTNIKIEEEKNRHAAALQKEQIEATEKLERMRNDPNFFIKEEKEKIRILELEEQKRKDEKDRANEKQKSPYHLKRDRHSSGKWGYSIYHTINNKPLSVDGNYQFFDDVKNALKILNELESVQGYKKTEME